MAITDAGRRSLKLDSGETLRDWETRQLERVKNYDRLIDAREELLAIDRVRADVLREIADLCSKLGMSAETRELV